MKKITAKQQITLTTTLASMAIFFCCFASSLSAKVLTFEGIAKPFITATLNYGYNDHYRGIVQWTALPGDIVKGPIYDKDGKTIRPGDVLVKLDTTYQESVVKTKEDDIKIAEANFDWTKAQFERYKTLSKTRAVSLQLFQEAKNNYLEAVAKLDSAKANLIAAKEIFNITTYRTQFAAIVDKVLVPSGLLAGHPGTIQISQIDPITINIKMPRQIAKQITSTTSIKVFPQGSDRPVGIFSGENILTDTGIRLLTDNWAIPPKKNNLPMIKELRPVMRLSLSRRGSVKLSVAEKAIKKDKSGTYVWYVTNAKDIQSGSSLPDIFNLMKVYIKTENLTQKVDNHWVYVELKNPGILKQYDLIAKDVPKGFKGGNVYWPRDRLLFMPGDPVKVEINLNNANSTS